MRKLFPALALAAASLAAAPLARARSPVHTAPPVAATDGSWASQLDGLAVWLEAHREKTPCSDRCYAIERLDVRGAVGSGPLDFEIEGTLLEPGPIDVPLFSPAASVRLEHVTDAAGRPALIAFADDQYFARVDARHFVLRGKLTLGDDLSVTVPGPVNTVEARLSRGRLVEGARMSGVQGAVLHFDRETSDRPPEQPTVFQLSRAVRVGRETTFEYKMDLQSGTDLGLARLPLRYGEKVLEVEGATGWKLEGEELVVPLGSSKTATVVVRGTLPRVGSFSPDSRSASEWWLLESDAEHRLDVAGDASQLDAAQAPFTRTQPNGRLFLVKRGQHLDVSMKTLASVDVLAAVVRSHHRTLVVTKDGDVVAEDALVYENSGVDYLAYDAAGKPLFVAVDGRSERVLQDVTSRGELMLPLRTGAHAVRVQSVAHGALGALGGRMVVPMPSHPLTTSESSITVGLPSHVRPVAFTGGEHTTWFVHLGDLVAMCGGALLAWLVLRRRAVRVLGAIFMAGLWAVSPAAFAAVTALAVACTAGRAVGTRLAHLRGRARWLALAAAALLGGGAFLVVAGAASRTASSREPAVAVDGLAQTIEKQAPVGAASSDAPAGGERESLDRRDATNAPQAPPPAQAASAATAVVNSGSVLRGVTPVALTLPGWSTSIDARRELVTRERPFAPTLWYVTDATLAPLLALWLLAGALLLRAHRSEIATLRDALRRRLESRPVPDTARE